MLMLTLTLTPTLMLVLVLVLTLRLDRLGGGVEWNPSKRSPFPQGEAPAF